MVLEDQNLLKAIRIGTVQPAKLIIICLGECGTLPKPPIPTLTTEITTTRKITRPTRPRPTGTK